MHTHSIRILLALTVAVFGVAAAWTARAAEPSHDAFIGKDRGGRTGVAERSVAVQRCQRRITDEDIGVCCRIKHGNRYRDKMTSRRNCRGSDKTIVPRNNCPRRPRGDGSNPWVCCEIDETPGFGVRMVLGGGKVVSRKLLRASECKKRRGSKAIARHYCVKKQSRRDRMIECKKRGKDWVWKNNRCQRAAVRDKRHY